jgi:uncharacterized caspase-like protein
MGAKKALLIGVSQYPPGWRSLPAASEDANALHLLLLAAEVGNFNDAKVLSNPDRQGIEEEVYALAQNARPDDLILLYFSGHGYRDEQGKLYLITAITRKDPQGELVKPTAVLLTALQDILNGSPATQQIVILDCCFDQSTALTSPAAELEIQSQLGGNHRMVLTASRTTTYAPAQKQSEHSLYTGYFIEGIQTGTANRTIAGLVPATQLHEYARRKVEIAAPAVEPAIYLPQPGFEVFLTNAPLVDAKVSYRQEVEARSQNGKTTISDFDRLILNWRRDRLSLSPDTTQEIEQTVFQPRTTYQQKLQQYRQKLSNIVGYRYPLRAATAQDLERYRDQMGLPQEQAAAIAEEIITPHEQQYQQNLQRYQQHLTHEMQLANPPSREVRNELRYLEQQLCLKPEDVAAIQQRAIAQSPGQPHHEPLQNQLSQNQQPQNQPSQNQQPQNQQPQNQQSPNQPSPTASQQPVRFFAEAIAPHFPEDQALQPQETPRGESEQTSVDSATQLADYQHRLHQYRQFFLSKFRPDQPFNDQTLYELTSQQSVLQLSDVDVAHAEAEATAEKLKDYEQKLQQYEQEFTRTAQSESLTHPFVRDRLKHLQQDLDLADQDVELVEKIALELLDQQPAIDPISANQPDQQPEPDASDGANAATSPHLDFLTFEDVLAANSGNEPSPQDAPPIELPTTAPESLAEALSSEPPETREAAIAPVSPIPEQLEPLPGIRESGVPRSGRSTIPPEPPARSHMAPVRAAAPAQKSLWQRLQEPETLTKFGLQALKASLLAMLAIIIGRLLITAMLQFLPPAMGQILGIAVFALAVVLAWKALNLLAF